MIPLVFPGSHLTQAPPVSLDERTPRASFIRLRSDQGPAADEIERFVDRLFDRQLSFMVDLVCLEHDLSALAAASPDPALLVALRRSAADLTDARSTLGEVLDDATLLPVLPLLAPAAPLSVYIQGLLVACDRLVLALSDAARDALEGVAVSRPALRRSVAEVQVTLFNALADEIRGDLGALSFVDRDARATLAGFSARVDELLFCGFYLHDRLPRRFG